MSKLSISNAWTETGAFLAKEGRLVFPVALLLLAIPAAASQLLQPVPPAQPAPGEAWIGLLLAIATAILGLVAGVAISHLALTPGASVAEALRRGFGRFLPLLVASLLIAIPIMLLAFMLFLAITPSIMGSGQPLDPNNLPAPVRIVIALLALIVVAFWVRISMATPVATAERGGGLALLQRSWQLTRGHYWKLLGAFVMLLLVCSLVVLAFSFGFGAVIVLAAGPPAFSSTAFALITIVDALLQAIVAAVLVTFVARLYAQLTGPQPPA